MIIIMEWYAPLIKEFEKLKHIHVDICYDLKQRIFFFS